MYFVLIGAIGSKKMRKNAVCKKNVVPLYLKIIEYFSKRKF